MSTEGLGNTIFTERRHSEQSGVGLTGSYETPRIGQAEVRFECSQSILVRRGKSKNSSGHFGFTPPVCVASRSFYYKPTSLSNARVTRGMFSFKDTNWFAKESNWEPPTRPDWALTATGTPAHSELCSNALSEKERERKMPCERRRGN